MIYARLQVEWEENNFLNPLRVLGWIWTWKPSQENEDPATCPEQEAFIAFRLKKKKSVKNEWAWDGEELTRRIRVSLTRFFCQYSQPHIPHLYWWEIFPPNTGSVPSTWELSDVIQGQGYGRKVRVTFLLFSNSFSLSFTMYQGAVCPELLHKQMMYQDSA